MTNSNYPSANTPNQSPRKDNKGLIYGILIAALLGTWGYVIWDKNKSKEIATQLQTQVITADSAKQTIQLEYDAAIVRLDSISGAYNSLSGKAAESESEITKLKSEIRGILSNRNATRAELNRAKSLINELNARIVGMEDEIARLTEENQVLTSTNTQLSQEKMKLEEDFTNVNTVKTDLEGRIDVGSTLNASNFNIIAVQEKNSGKEVTTSKAKKADKFRVSFDVMNRLTASGTKELFIILTDPEGKTITEPELGSGSFTTREEGEKTYTNKVTTEYEQGQRKTINFDLKQAERYVPGDYQVEIYQNGFKIGNGKVTLRKGGLFG